MIKYLPITQKDKERVHKYSDKLLPGIFLGYSQQSGGGWNGDFLLCDWEQLAAAELCTDAHIKRFMSKEVHPVLKDDAFYFPVASGELTQPGVTPLERIQTDPFGSQGVTLLLNLLTTTKARPKSGRNSNHSMKTS